METGAITSYIDVAQVVLYAFWIFFACLILYLRREDKREGYPLESDRSGRVQVIGFPAPPEPKVFRLPHGGTQTAPREEPPREVKAEPVGPWPGAPLQPTGNPMLDGVGPAAYANRAEEPERTAEGEPKIIPLRLASDFYVERRDPDPRGKDVIAADNRVAGTVVDLWIDCTEPQIRYLEVEVPAPEGPKRVLLPIGFARITGWPRGGQVKVRSLMANQFANVPRIQNSDQITLREEDRICAYYAGGQLYADPERQEPLI